MKYNITKHAATRWKEYFSEYDVEELEESFKIWFILVNKLMLRRNDCLPTDFFTDG
jgi:hypothetical protein